MKEFSAGTGDINVKVLVDRSSLGKTIRVLNSSLILVESDLFELATMSSSSHDRELCVTYKMPWSEKKKHKVCVTFLYSHDAGLLMLWKESWVSGYIKHTEEFDVMMNSTEAKDFLQYVTNWPT